MHRDLARGIDVCEVLPVSLKARLEDLELHLIADRDQIQGCFSVFIGLELHVALVFSVMDGVKDDGCIGDGLAALATHHRDDQVGHRRGSFVLPPTAAFLRRPVQGGGCKGQKSSTQDHSAGQQFHSSIVSLVSRLRHVTRRMTFRREDASYWETTDWLMDERLGGVRVDPNPRSENQEKRIVMAQHTVKEMPGRKSREKQGAPGPHTKVNTKMYATRIALSEEQKEKTVQVMQQRLAAALDMYSQAKFAHWNVKGVNFYQLHLVFDSVADAIFPQIDEIAERLTQLGGVANGTVRQSAETSRIPEFDVELTAGMDYVKALADALGCYCEELREASDQIDEIGDEPTSDFFKQLVVTAEEQLYFLESHLEAGDVQ